MKHINAGLLVSVLLTGILICSLRHSLAADEMRIGSKRFTESYILAEIVAQTARNATPIPVTHKAGLGNTAILFAALKSGAIDAYPDYTGTVALELLGLDRVPPLPELNQYLAQHGLAAGIAFGFSNAYALAMRRAEAGVDQPTTISALSAAGHVRPGFSPEFIARKDGWPGLKELYGLQHLQPRTLDHGLAYGALAGKQVDLIDVYTTDPKILRDQLLLLQDDRAYFPPYEAVLIYRKGLPLQHSAAWAALQTLEGRISPDRMRSLNAAVEFEGRSFATAATAWLQGHEQAKAPRAGLGALIFADDFFRLSAEHLLLVAFSLILGIALAVPLGMLAYFKPGSHRWVMGGAGVLQTIPSLALLAFLIAAFERIGTVPAVIALFLYSLLPILNATETALSGIGKGVRAAALALGMTWQQRLLSIDIPLALPGIFSGIRTAAVINVGTATIAALVGAGGYGDRIVAGLAVNDFQLMLAGAIPAAVLAIVIELGFRMIERQLAASQAAT